VIPDPPRSANEQAVSCWGSAQTRRLLEAEIAFVMETEPELLPHLPFLLQDLDELGGNVAAALDLIDLAGDAPGAALDLGCGKGTFAIALARRGWTVHGADAFTPFLETARQRAETEGVADHCAFWAGDMRAALETGPLYDLVSMLSVGPILGDIGETVRALRAVAKPGGLILIDDAFLADGLAEPPPGYEQYAGHEATRELLTSHGDALIAERVFTTEEMRAIDARVMPAIRRRAAELIDRAPDLASSVRAYLARQEQESEWLAGAVRPVMWLLRKGA